MSTPDLHGSVGRAGGSGGFEGQALERNPRGEVLAAAAVVGCLAGDERAALRAGGEMPRPTARAARARGPHAIDVRRRERRPVAGRAITVGLGRVTFRHAALSGLEQRLAELAEQEEADRLAEEAGEQE